MHLVKGLKAVHKSHSEYESVEDNKDLRIPVQNEDAFKHGIIFKAKYIGTQEITKPSSRVEIVSSMRRIRYEYKYRNIKKRKVHLEISVNGIKVTIWKKKKFLQEGRFEESQLFVMCYPINRVFYVSHDSQDLLIFSYIARGDDGLFRCSVFKAFRKAQAMGIVRTIGQAFEVCHKLNLAKSDSQVNSMETVEEEKPAEDGIDRDEKLGETGETDIDDTTLPLKDDIQNFGTVVTDLDKVKQPESQNIFKVSADVTNGIAGLQTFGNTAFVQMQQIFQQQLNHQIQEAEAAKAETMMLKEKLRIESEGRSNAQARVQKLLAQNRELLITIQKMMIQLQNTQGKGLFDPVDESWMTSSFPVNDSSFPPSSEPISPLKSKITSDCLSSIYGNEHHHSVDPGFNDYLCSTQQTSQNDCSKSFNNVNQSINNNITDEVLKGNQLDILDVSKLSEDKKEGQGGISTSFSDLRQVGIKENEADWNHNRDHITKFSARSPSSSECRLTADEVTNEADNMKNELLVESGNSVFSKEMLETFSDEICEMQGEAVKVKTSVN